MSRGSRRSVHELVLHIDQSLAMRISEITLMRWTQVDHGLVDRVGDFVRENTRGQAGYTFVDL